MGFFFFAKHHAFFCPPSSTVHAVTAQPCSYGTISLWLHLAATEVCALGQIQLVAMLHQKNFKLGTSPVGVSLAIGVGLSEKKLN